MAELLERRLQAFLRRSCALEYRDGHVDCGLWLANWLMERTGMPDPAASLRGRYQDEESRATLLDAPYPVIFGRLLRRAGLRATPNPVLGDVGVIRPLGGPPVGAIRTATGWAMLGRRGLVGLPADTQTMMAWGF